MALELQEKPGSEEILMEQPAEIRRRIVGKQPPAEVLQLPLPDPLSYGPPIHDMVAANHADDYEPSIAPLDEATASADEDVLAERSDGSEELPLVSKLDQNPKKRSGGGSGSLVEEKILEIEKRVMEIEKRTRGLNERKPGKGNGKKEGPEKNDKLWRNVIERVGIVVGIATHGGAGRF